MSDLAERIAASMTAADSGGSAAAAAAPAPSPSSTATAVLDAPGTDAGGEAAGAEPSIPDDYGDQIEFSEELQSDQPAKPTAEAEKPPAAAPAKPEGEEETLPGLTPEESHKVREEFLKTPGGKALMSTHKMMGDLAKPVDEGGIGHVPSAVEIKRYYQDSVDVDTMKHEFEAGNPTDTASFIANWLFDSPEMNRLRPGATQFVSQLPQILMQGAPKLYGEVLAPFVVNQYVRSLYARAGREADPEFQAHLRNVGRHIEHDLTGQWTPDEEVLKMGKADPLATRERQLTQREQQIQQFEQQRVTETQNRFESNVVSDMQRAIDQDIDAALRPISKAYEHQPVAFRGLRRELKELVGNALEKDQDGDRRFSIRMEQAKRTMTNEDHADLVRAYRGLVQSQIRRIAPQFLREAAQAVMGNSQARHTQLAAGAGKRGVTPVGGASTQQRQPKPTERQPGEDRTDWMQRTIRDKMVAASGA